MPSKRKASKPTASSRRAVLSAVALAAAVVAAWLTVRSVALAAAPDVPKPAQYVEDLAGIIDPASKIKLLGYLQELEEKTGTQIIVLTVKTTGGVPIEQFAIDLAEKWKLGQKGKDNGALVVVAVDDRTYRFEIGRGLEGPLPDAFVGRIGRDFFVPYFRQGRYGEGLFQGVVAMLARLETEFNVTLTGLPRMAQPARGVPGEVPARGSDFLRTIATALIAIFVLMMVIRHPWLLLLFMSGGRGGGWSGGSRSGGFGGGFGSFGGGGGGSFGGGGATGHW